MECVTLLAHWSGGTQLIGLCNMRLCSYISKWCAVKEALQNSPIGSTISIVSIGSVGIYTALLHTTVVLHKHWCVAIEKMRCNGGNTH